jgi:transposase
MRGPQTEGMTKENLKRLYVDDPGATLESVAEILGSHRETVRRWLKRYGLPVKAKARPGQAKKAVNKPLEDAEWLKKQLETKTAIDIARELGTTDSMVWHWRKLHSLEFDESRSEAVKAALAKRYPEGRFGENASNWRGGRRKIRGGYIYIYAPEHPNATNNGCVMEHRLVMEEILGRYLESDEIVHHVDGNKSNNDLGNLVVMRRGEHVTKHFEALDELIMAERRIAELEAEIAELRGEN